MSIELSRNHLAGFAEPASEAQGVFRAVLQALARPTTPQRIAAAVAPPPPLGTVSGAIALTLCDAQSPVWLDRTLRASDDVVAWLAFHTGAPLVEDPADALFVFASSPSAVPPLARLAQGSDVEPHRSSTLLIDTTAAEPTGVFTASGPGINGSTTWDSVGLPDGFVPQWQANHALFPRGVDLLLTGENTVVGLPRTTELVVKEAV
ncbi:phosphonate C-P lyase system protein PhnH [Nocardia sp. NPDC004711]